jgi:hypothetical protein
MANMDAAPQVILHTSMGDITVEVLTYYSFSFPSAKCCLFCLLVLLPDKIFCSAGPVD